VAGLRGTEDRQPGLFVTGNYLSGLSIAACVAEAHGAAARAHGYLLGFAGRAEATAKTRSAAL
jgi:heterodisulfide reductase subunit A-like polyferredoxin